MVKVRIEYKGQVREFEKDAVIAFFSDKERAQAVFAGEDSTERAVRTLSVGILSFLERVFDDRMDYVSAMIEVRDEIEEKIKEELKAGGIHPLVDALTKAMGRNSKNENYTM